MFDSLETGKRIKGSKFDKLELPLRHQLLTAQFDLAAKDYPVIILVAGLDGAGKGALVHRLNEWMDPRGIQTNTFWEPSDEEDSRPVYWRFWRKLPARGEIGIFLGTWYNQPAQASIAGDMEPEEFTRQCAQIECFERMLSDDGALIIKLWLHISRDTQRQQLEETAPDKQQNPRVTDKPYELHGQYEKSLEVAEQMILQTDSQHSPWHLLEAEDCNYRDITAGQIILDAMLVHSANHVQVPAVSTVDVPGSGAGQPTVLDSVDLGLKLKKSEYKEQLAKYQARLQDLAWQAYRNKRSVVAVFEGWDAAGKGSAIRRVTRSIDPRLFRLVQFAAPTDEEQAHHYLWRFWRQIERDGRSVFFDRSWYGRVLVERVEHFAAQAEWRRAYNEINQFEDQLVRHGSIVLKFWLHISEDEQLKRFKARENQPHKRHKITEDDWRNREKWQDYKMSVDQMVQHTSTSYAPWTLVSGDDKYYARIQILKTFCKAMQQALKQ